MFEMIQDREGRERRTENARYTLLQFLYLPIVIAAAVTIIEYGWFWGSLFAVALGFGCRVFFRFLGVLPRLRIR